MAFTERCKNVAKRFEQAMQNSSLKYSYVAIGTLKELNVVCLVKKQGDLCTEEGLLFTLQKQYERLKAQCLQT